LIARRRGVGDSGGQSLVTASGGSGAQYNSAGQYIGGSPMMDFWCNSVFGSWTDTCKISTPAQIRAQQIAELQQTSAPDDAIQQAIASGDAAVIADAVSNAQGYQEQIAASEHPTLSAVLGTGITSMLFPKDVSDPNNPTSGFPWLMIGIGVGGFFLLNSLIGGRR